jgi:hypothetical protein
MQTVSYVDGRVYMLNEAIFETVLVPARLQQRSLLIDFGLSGTSPVRAPSTHNGHFLLTVGRFTMTTTCRAVSATKHQSANLSLLSDPCRLRHDERTAQALANNSPSYIHPLQDKVLEALSKYNSNEKFCIQQTGLALTELPRRAEMLCLANRTSYTNEASLMYSHSVTP